jgi:SAM-dependent methyltransferase
MDNSKAQGIRDQFSMRIETYETAANWMLDADLINAFIKAAGPPPPGKNKCLEICCGTGIQGRAMQDAGWQVSGVDLTFEMVEVAKRYFPSQVGDVENMDFNNEFDLVLIRQAYMLLDGPKALASVKRALKPGGRFLLGQSVAFEEGEEEARYRKIQEARHIHMKKYYRAIDLIKELIDHGFTVRSQQFLTVRESATHWMKYALALSPERKNHILELIRNAPPAYKKARDVVEDNGHIFEDWKWVILTAEAG